MANAGIILRPYRDSDEDTALAIWWESWHSIRSGLQHPRPLADWRTRWVGEIVPAQAIVVAEDRGIVVGFAAADLKARELTQIFVTPDRKRQGIGRRLLAWAQEQMPAGFSLHTLVENTPSRAFYQRHGLREGDTGTNPVNGMSIVEYHWTPHANRP
jgi:GNAT superfamily N-acetyltransferase